MWRQNSKSWQSFDIKSIDVGGMWSNLIDKINLNARIELRNINKKLKNHFFEEDNTQKRLFQVCFPLQFGDRKIDK